MQMNMQLCPWHMTHHIQYFIRVDTVEICGTASNQPSKYQQGIPCPLRQHENLRTRKRDAEVEVLPLNFWCFVNSLLTIWFADFVF